MRKIVALFCTMITNNTLANSKDYFPSNILQLDPYLSHHVIVAEKSTHKLYLFENKNGIPNLLSTIQVATGKKAGNKIFQGDHRTPEGIYHFSEFLPHRELLKRHGKAGEIYGVGAFVMNYPNPIDELKGKTGGGIWLHSTNDETRIDKGLDSRGCIVAHNENLIKLSQYIELNKTHIVVTHNMNFQKKSTWEREKAELSETVNGWLTAWKTENIENYKDYYHKKKFRDNRHKTYNRYVTYKKHVFANPGTPEISISNLSVFKNNEYAVVSFIQNYKSNTIEDVGKKTLYLMKDEYYNWRIVSEKWTKAGLIDTDHNASMAFEPKMRFFESLNPKEIFTSDLNLKENSESSN